jgi:hypothetical protein
MIMGYNLGKETKLVIWCLWDILLACFTGSMCLSLMERTTVIMENRKTISSGGEVNNMQRSNIRRENTVQKRDPDQNP